MLKYQTGNSLSFRAKQKVKKGHKTNMDFPTICKKFYYCLHQTTLYVKVILLKACFKYEKAYIKNRFFKDFTGRVHLHVSLLPPLWNGELTPSLSGIPSDTVDDEATTTQHAVPMTVWPDRKNSIFKNPTVVGKNKWFFERTIFCCEKILDLINSCFGSLVTLENGT